MNGYDKDLHVQVFAASSCVLVRLNKGAERRIPVLRHVLLEQGARLTESIVSQLASSGHFTDAEVENLFDPRELDSKRISLFDREEIEEYPCGTDIWAQKKLAVFADGLEDWIQTGSIDKFVFGASIGSDLPQVVFQEGREALDHLFQSADKLISDPEYWRIMIQNIREA